MNAQRAQDSRGGRPLRRSLAWALLLGAAGCVQPPSESVDTPYGVVRADTAEQARELAEMLNELRPRVVALLPDAVDRSTEVWLDSGLRGSELAGDESVAALTNISAGRIQLRGDAGGIDLDFLLAHELVHALMGESWDPLPAVMKEGLCDSLAARLVPKSAPLARALRMFAARFAFGDQALDLALTEPDFGGRWGTRIDIASPGVLRRDPLDALALQGRGIRLHGDTEDEDALYGYGLLVVERAIDRIGVEGLNAMCREARDAGSEVVPPDWLLWAAGLDTDLDTWDRALAEAFGPAELDALTGHLAEGLAGAIVSNCRYRFPDFDAAGFRQAAAPTLGLHGGDLEVGLDRLPDLASAIDRAWTARPVHPMHPGDSRWYVDRLGLHMGQLHREVGTDPGLVLEWIVIGPEAAATLLQPGAGADDVAGAPVEASLLLGRDDGGPFVASTLPGPFEQFRVELDGVVVADLATALGVETSSAPDGSITVRCRLDAALAVEQAVLYDPAPNLIVSQRPLGQPPGGRWPFRVPIRP
jgi:hypothetical protein